MLDRGQDQDWFGSREIIVEAVLAGLGFYLFVVHMVTAQNAVHPAARSSRTATSPRRPADDVRGRHRSCWPARPCSRPGCRTSPTIRSPTAGLLLAPRGLGTMAAMLIAGRLSNRVDPRMLMAFGMLIAHLQPVDA